jgi:membrane-associated phospholipid phosphatase
MDTITSLALSVDSPLLAAAGLAIAGEIVYGALIIAIALAAERRNDKRLKILASLAATIAFCVVVKQLTAHARPCAGLDWCPADYSFPSLHAAAAFALAIAFLDKKAYPLFLLFALFVSFTRLNLGVHVFADIAAALPLAMLSYYAVDLAWPRMGGGHGKGN